MDFDFYWKREYPLWYGAAATIGLQRLMREMLRTRITIRGEGQDGWFSIFSEEGSKDRMLSEMRTRLEEDSKYLHSSIEQVHKAGQAFVEAGKTAGPEKYFEAYASYSTELFISFYLVEIVSEMFYEKYNALEMLESIRPAKKSNLARIREYFERHEDIDERIAYCRETYPGLGSIDPFVQPCGEEDFRSFAESFRHAEKKQIRPESDLAKAYAEVLYLKDRRDDYRRESFYHAHDMMARLAEEMGITAEELGFLLPNEYKGGYRKKIEDRKKGYVITLNEDLEIEAGNITFQDEEKQTSEVKGIAGSKGIARGKAQVIRKMEDVKKFREGRILVAVTTDPNYVSAMQKATAFVTDEGGVACHAAIIARELDVPCVVGTGNATKVFKDGEMIEVDANNGIARRIGS